MDIYNSGATRTPDLNTLCRSDVFAQIAANWGGGSVAGCNNDHVVIHYYGMLTVPDTGPYKFRNIADDGWFMTIDGQVITDEWRDKGCSGSWSQPITLNAGKSYALDAWYYENGGGACSTLYVTQPSGNWQVVPSVWFGQGSVTTYIKDESLLPAISAAQANLDAAKAALAAIPSMQIDAPTNLSASVDTGTVTLTWDAPIANLIPERYAVFWTVPGADGWGVASTTTSIVLDKELFKSTGGWNKDYTFTVRSDQDTAKMYSSLSNSVTVHLDDPTPPVVVVTPSSSPSPSETPTATAQPTPAVSESPQLQPVVTPEPSVSPQQPLEPVLPTPTPSETPTPQAPLPSPSSTPTEQPSSTPSPSITPSPQPLPAPSPSPAPAPTPTPTPQPTPEPVPAKPLDPPPAPADPTPTPEPTPVPQPSDTPMPPPDPKPTDTPPAPAPKPSEPPAPAPSPKPTEQPPSPAPSPAPTPPATPAPEPSQPPKVDPPKVEPSPAPTPPSPSPATVPNLIPNNPTSLPKDTPIAPPTAVLVPHVQVDVAGVENGGIQFFGTQSAPQVVQEDGSLTPPAPPPGSGLPIPPEAITTSETFIGQPGGTTFNAPDVAVPVVLTPLPSAVSAIPGAEAVNKAFVALSNIGNDMSPVTRKKAKKILVATIVATGIAQLRRRP